MPISERKAVDLGGGSRSRIVYQQIDTTEAIINGIYHADDIFFLNGIGLNRHDIFCTMVMSHFIRCFPGSLAIQIGDDHTVAIISQPFGQKSSQAFTATNYQRYFRHVILPRLYLTLLYIRATKLNNV
ncbi:hypothetical protein A9R10_01730 [Aeromonas piscicola]|nr:hypothetical protein A9R10_01730 [Aeromonas piscicola]